MVLVNPEIAANTGNIIRLCANTGTNLHLVEPLGFVLEDARLKRAGLDYHELANLVVHPSWDDCVTSLGQGNAGNGVPGFRGDTRRFAFTARAQRRYDSIAYRRDDVVVFGAERAGLDAEMLDTFDDDHRLAIPMMPNNRSLNLANAVSIVVYEAWRQSGFAGADGFGQTAETLER